jgi:hypothetical protein
MQGFFEQVRDVVVIASSSRGGSTLVMELLRDSPDIRCLRGEINPFLRLTHLDARGSGTGSDALNVSHCHGAPARILERELAIEAGSPAMRFEPGHDDITLFAQDVCWRLMMQWPDTEIVPERVHSWIIDTFAELQAEHGWQPGEFRDEQLFHACFLRRVHSAIPHINPYYYDLDASLVRRMFPDANVPAGPPSDTIIEEPPFILLRPWRRCSERDLATCPLVLKTPSNAYRLDFLRALFPTARFRILHLMRNPAASVNGLIDGWLHHGFHAHRMDEPLAISGYCDVRPGDAHWWKFDLPPQWQEWRQRPLQEVCGFQWYVTHAFILEFVEREGVDYFPLRFEDIIGSLQLRLEVMRRLCRWLEIPMHDRFSQAISQGTRPVMATRPPCNRRWVERSSKIEQVLKDAKIQEMIKRLAYTDNSQWI